ncbi:LIS1 homology motif protein [Artemisia annua]|uniref:LIS1 homology motif protein n=1 Tax=Artemisia annua TaxID=35608 RepID=A0A2U1Q0C7_ARTAN|nr:LIS1 homology motif protein [Artemisia annua]
MVVVRFEISIWEVGSREKVVHKPFKKVARPVSFSKHWLMYYNVFSFEQESAFYFNMKYFEDKVQAGEWDDVEQYLCGFTKVEGNRYSMKIFFELRKKNTLSLSDEIQWANLETS